jgi:energy-coupling factor transporter ATP-binding protein EcfA2
MDTLSMIRYKRASAIAIMEEPIIRFDLGQINEVLKLIDDLESDKKTLMNDLATVNIQLGKK